MPNRTIAFGRGARNIKGGVVKAIDALEGGLGASSGAPSERLADVRFGSQADICTAQRDVRFAPNRDRESGFLQKAMSALHPEADLCATLAYVCFGPKADITRLFDHLICAPEIPGGPACQRRTSWKKKLTSKNLSWRWLSVTGATRLIPPPCVSNHLGPGPRM
jgi:hypothetical protein